MNSTKPIDVLLADDHQMLRQGLRKILESEGDIAIVGEAATGREAVTMSRELRPAVVVMDIAMPLLNGLEAMRQILDAEWKPKVLILSAHSDDAYVEKSVSLGAAGFLLKQTSAQVLAEAIREIEKGNTFFGPLISKRQHRQKDLDREGHLKRNGSHLTPREMEVLQLIAEGLANKQIAAELGISIKTVEKHRTHLMQKLDIHDTAGLTRYVIEAGIIESSVQLTILQE
ncbi:MAG: response regulator transcription factor [Pontiellaceae bacterium]|nr:response regulator transcription factor [Pontiellaceae bacterium]